MIAGTRVLVCSEWLVLSLFCRLLGCSCRLPLIFYFVTPALLIVRVAEAADRCCAWTPAALTHRHLLAVGAIWLTDGTLRSIYSRISRTQLRLLSYAAIIIIVVRCMYVSKSNYRSRALKRDGDLCHSRFGINYTLEMPARSLTLTKNGFACGTQGQPVFLRKRHAAAIKA